MCSFCLTQEEEEKRRTHLGVCRSEYLPDMLTRCLARAGAILYGRRCSGGGEGEARARDSQGWIPWNCDTSIPRTEDGDVVRSTRAQRMRDSRAVKQAPEQKKKRSVCGRERRGGASCTLLSRSLSISW